MTRVKSMAQSVDYNGQRYGPSAGPIEIPEELANALGLREMDDEDAEAQPAPADAAAGQELLQANADLKADLDKANAELDRVTKELEAETRKGDQAYESYSHSYDQFEADRKSFKKELDAARAELETAQREGNEAQAQVATLTEQLKAAQAKALPDDAEARMVAVKGIGKDLAKAALDALTAPAQK